MDFFELINLTNKLGEIHLLQKDLYGSEWNNRVADVEARLREEAKTTEGNLIGAAVQLCRVPNQDPRLTLLYIGAAIELKFRDSVLSDSGKGNNSEMQESA